MKFLADIEVGARTAGLRPEKEKWRAPVSRYARHLYEQLHKLSERFGRQSSEHPEPVASCCWLTIQCSHPHRGLLRSARS